MQLTMAMGLRYEPGVGVSLLTDFKRGQESASARPENGLLGPASQVIDVEAIEVREGKVIDSGSGCHFDYLVYNLHAGVVPLPLIGSRLDRLA